MSDTPSPGATLEEEVAQVERLRHEGITWQLCQFLHGEQGALLATAQIVDAVPWYEAKRYGATQVMDEARHVEVYRRFVQEKLEHQYPVNAQLKALLDQILTERDIPHTMRIYQGEPHGWVLIQNHMGEVLEFLTQTFTR